MKPKFLFFFIYLVIYFTWFFFSSSRNCLPLARVFHQHFFSCGLSCVAQCMCVCVCERESVCMFVLRVWWHTWQCACLCVLRAYNSVCVSVCAWCVCVCVWQGCVHACFECVFGLCWLHILITLRACFALGWRGGIPISQRWEYDSWTEISHLQQTNYNNKPFSLLRPQEVSHPPSNHAAQPGLVKNKTTTTTMHEARTHKTWNVFTDLRTKIQNENVSILQQGTPRHTPWPCEGYQESFSPGLFGKWEMDWHWRAWRKSSELTLTHPMQSIYFFGGRLLLWFSAVIPRPAFHKSANAIINDFMWRINWNIALRSPYQQSCRSAG